QNGVRTGVDRHITRHRVPRPSPHGLLYHSPCVASENLPSRRRPYGREPPLLCWRWRVVAEFGRYGRLLDPGGASWWTGIAVTGRKRMWKTAICCMSTLESEANVSASRADPAHPPHLGLRVHPMPCYPQEEKGPRRGAPFQRPTFL